MTDLSWIYCCIHDVHPTLKCCLEWEIMENVLNFDLESLHIICNIRMTLTGARAFAVFTGTNHPALAAAASGILSLIGYESSQWGDRTLYPRILTEQSFISMALKAMQPSWLNKSTFWQKRSLFAPEFLLRWTPGSWNCLRLQQHLPIQMFLCHLESQGRVLSVPLFPFVCRNCQLQGGASCRIFHSLHHPQRWVRNSQKVKPIWQGLATEDKQHLPPEEEPGSQSQHYQNWL